MINVQISEQEFKEIQLKNYSRSLERIKRYPSGTHLGLEIEELLAFELAGDLSSVQELQLQWFRDLFTWDISGGSVFYGTEVYVSDQLVDVYCDSVEQILALWSGKETPEIEIDGPINQPFSGSFHPDQLCESDFEISPRTDEPQGVQIFIRNLNLRDQD